MSIRRIFHSAKFSDNVLLVSLNIQPCHKCFSSFSSSWINKLFRQKQNYYELLDVKKTASTEEIRQAFLNKSKDVHPDRNRSADAQEEFKLLNEAYSVLKNRSSRIEYDSKITDGDFKDRYFKEDGLVFDKVTGRIFRDDGSAKVRKGTASTFCADPKEARKSHVKLISALMLLGFAYTFSSVVFVTRSSNKQEEVMEERDADGVTTILKF